MKRAYSLLHHTHKYSKHSSIIWTVLPNGSVFLYEISGSVFLYETCSSWHSVNYRGWIYSEMHAWHDKNIESLKFLVKSFAIEFFFTDHLKYKTANKTTRRMPSANPRELFTYYLKNFPIVLIICLGFQDFLIYYSTTFLQEQYKLVSLIVWKKITTFFKRRVSIILWSFLS